ncbi:MAG: chemotaxis protein CheX [Gammaproteobacteria bacterium]|nr:MAG: chemotaxis protein CheX [Gammaproteobacteria bacterium]
MECVERYFTKVNNTGVTIGTPYIVENSTPAAHDMTGIIGVSGPYKGCVYYTAPKVLLTHLLASIGENDFSEENVRDLIGEITNIIAGNAREEFGKEFMISVPVVISGTPDNIQLPQGARSFVIPIYWKSYESLLVVSLIAD